MTCFGCGAESGLPFPFVGVGRAKADIEGIIARNTGLNPGELAAKIHEELKAAMVVMEHAICAACHANPLPGLKLHYFPLADAPSRKLGMANIPSNSVALTPGS